VYSASKFTDALKSEARRLGFDLAGACSAVNATGFEPLVDWLAAGYAGEMAYLERRIDAYRHPEGVMPGTLSLLLLGLNYRTVEPIQGEAGTGRISRYAWGQVDYHDLIRLRLKQLEAFATASLIELGQADARVRGVVDTAPLLEREFAQLAGLGWQGKNTMLIRPQFGSWFFLAGLLLSVELDYDQPFTANHCGTCTACLDHCPTQAFPQPGVLDATRCISYLTIEHRSPIDRTLRHKMNDWILGCDVCQEVCPWNRKGASSSEPAFLPTLDQNPVSLRELFFLTDDEFRKRFSKTPLWRPKRRGILRNAAIALGNRPHADNLIALKQGLVDLEPLVRGASAWALGQHRFPISFEALTEQLKAETDSIVTEEIEHALDSIRFD
jgi:epoxyqueuosine reductase